MSFKCMAILVCALRFLLLGFIALAHDTYAQHIDRPNLTVHLEVTDLDGKPVKKFQALARANAIYWCCHWRNGAEGKLTLSPDDFRCGMSEPFRSCQIIIRAPGFASQILPLLKFEGEQTKRVRLSPGHVLALKLDGGGRMLPESLFPEVYWEEFEFSVWANYQIQNGTTHRFADARLMDVAKVGEGRFTFRIPEQSPDFYVFFDQPGFSVPSGQVRSKSANSLATNSGLNSRNPLKLK